MADTVTATNARTAPRASTRARDEGRARPGFLREVRTSMPAVAAGTSPNGDSTE